MSRSIGTRSAPKDSGKVGGKDKKNGKSGSSNELILKETHLHNILDQKLHQT